MMTLSALNQFLKQHTTEETQRLNGVKKDYSQFPVARGKFDTPCYRFDTNLEDLRSLFLSKKVLPSYYNFAVVKQDRFGQSVLLSERKHKGLEQGPAQLFRACAHFI